MSIKISRILHAGYQIQSEQATILFDPIFENPFSRNCHAFPKVEFNLEKIKSLKPDAVFISHYHDDHCSFESLNLLNRDIPIYMFCVHAEMFVMLHELGFTNVNSLKLNTPVQVGDLEVIPRRALDHEVDCLLQVKSQGLNILNVVDSWIDEETLQLLLKQAPWDLIMWPFQTMREVEVLSPARYKTEPQKLPEEWLAQIKLLNPKYIIPSSCQFKMEPWSWYNQAFFPITYRMFSEEVNAILPSAHIQRLDPGKSYLLSQNGFTPSAQLEWINPVDLQNSDYEYDLNVIPQQTAEIAGHFPELTEEQKSRVRSFCNETILVRDHVIGPSADPYFNKARNWKLSLFSHDGKRHDYYYKTGEQLKRLSLEPQNIDWITEVPEQKLYAALEQGEALTSMYLRITCHDQDVDILEDPLIRILFSEGFATYQKAQLAKIKTQ